MPNKRIGVTLLVISIIFGIILFVLLGRLEQSSADHGCFPSEECQPIQRSLSLTHIAFGIFGFITALAIYLLYFAKGEEALLRQMEEANKKRLAEEKFGILLKALDGHERKILTIIKNEEGITQNMLPIRSGLSKAKVSYVVTELERRGLVRRVPKNKTQLIYLKEKL